MGNKSWIVTVVPLIVYLIGFGYTFTGNGDLTTQQAEMLTNLLYGFLGAGTIGVANKIGLMKISK